MTGRAGVRSTNQRRVFLNGREVTEKCWYFDTRRGIVGLFLVDLSGAVLMHPHEWDVMRYQRRGLVTTKSLRLAATTRITV